MTRHYMKDVCISITLRMKWLFSGYLWNQIDFHSFIFNDCTNLVQIVTVLTRQFFPFLILSGTERTFSRSAEVKAFGQERFKYVIYLNPNFFSPVFAMS